MILVAVLIGLLVMDTSWIAPAGQSALRRGGALPAGSPLVTDCPVTQPIRAEPPKDPNADPFGFGPWYINVDRTIWAGPDVGSWKSGSAGNKVLWIRPQGTQLTITGHRLEGAAAPLEARIPCCYPTGFQSTRLFFPSAGCWEITATAGKGELKFVAWVQ